MSRSMPHITAAELRIMKVFWRVGAATVRQVLDALPPDEDGPPAYTTVMTMMKQLAEKGALEVDRSRQPFVYTPTIRREAVLGARVLHLLQNVFDGQTEELVLHLVESADLSAEDLRRIEAKIRRREKADQARRDDCPTTQEEMP